jgi:leucine dehydrogenase
LLLNLYLRRCKKLFGQLSFDNHEQIVFCNDEDTGLKAIIGIHNTTLGPALGGTRMWQYNSEWEAVNDVLRLSRGMTYKSAITGLNLGGGKAVIIGDAKTQKNDKLMRRFGEFVNSLSGKYITAEDVGMETRDMDIIREVTPHVTGISESNGGAGNPSPITAYGVYMGMKAAAKYKFGTDNLNGKKILVQGIGHVGETLVKHISDEGAQVILNDINETRLSELSKKYDANVALGNDIYGLDIDIYAPCALGASLDSEFISSCNYSIIAGAANNQLENEQIHAKMLLERNIVYAPDFLINAGGLINVYSELNSFTRDEVYKKTEDIYNITLKILSEAQKRGVTPNLAALEIANKRLQSKIIL